MRECVHVCSTMRVCVFVRACAVLKSLSWSSDVVWEAGYYTAMQTRLVNCDGRGFCPGVCMYVCVCMWIVLGPAVATLEPLGSGNTTNHSLSQKSKVDQNRMYI